MHFVIPATNAISGNPVNMDLIVSFKKQGSKVASDNAEFAIRFFDCTDECSYDWTYATAEERDAEYDRICRHCNIITLSKQVF